MSEFICAGCSLVTESSSLDPVCPGCGSQLLLRGVPAMSPSRKDLDSLPPGVWRYRSFLPMVDEASVVTLGEGGTPLLRAERLGREMGLRNLYLKDESRNPTGSFMDRGTTVLVSLARRAGVTECSCVTTGNLGASLAAYCARADMNAHIRVGPGTDQGKLYQMLAYGAGVEAVAGNFREGGGGRSLHVSPSNPYLLEGEKTTGFELVQDLGWNPPDAVLVPVGTGGHLTMVRRAMEAMEDAGLADGRASRLLAVSLKGGGGPGRAKGSPAFPFAELQRSNPTLMDAASAAVSASRGAQLEATAEETLDATGILARTEGIFAEPSAASVIAGLRKAVIAGEVGRDETIVCVVTGSGLKDPRSVSRLARETRRTSHLGPDMLLTSGPATTKIEIMEIVGEKGSYGYDIWRRLGRDRRISTASVYQHLSELEGAGLVTRRSATEVRGRERVPYQLTKKGRDLLRAASRLEE